MMESSDEEQVQLTQSNTDSHYYSKRKYRNRNNTNLKNENVYKLNHNKYGSFTHSLRSQTANNRKHFRNKLISKSSSSSLTNLAKTNYDNNNNPPFSEYTPDPHYNLLSNDWISSMNVNLDLNDFYINSKDDISINSKDSDYNDYIDEEMINLIDSSSNCSFNTTESINNSLSKSTYNGTSSEILEEIKFDNKESSHHPLLGMMLVTISAVFYAALNLSVKALMNETPWQELMFIRMAITWIATMIWIFVQYKGRLSLCGPKHQRLFLLLRAFFLWGAMFTCWWSFEFLPVGDGTALQQSFPVWVSVFAHFVWRKDSSQRLDLFGWICVLAGLLGTVFVAQPSFIFGRTDSNNTSYRDIGIAIGLSSAICAGAQYVIVNYTKKDCHWLQVEQLTAGLSTFVLCPLGSVAFALYYYHGHNDRFVILWGNLNGARWAEEIALGLLGFCALALLTRGSQLDAPARTAICLYLEIPFVYIGQCIMTHSFPDVYIFIGIFLVLSSVIIPAVRKLRRSNKQKKLNEKLKHRKRPRNDRNDNDEIIRKYSDDSTFDNNNNNNYNNYDETIPLIQDDAIIGVGGVSGVTVDWSSEEESTGNTDIDDNNDEYNDIDRAVL